MHKQMTYMCAFKKKLSVTDIPSKSKLIYFSTMLEKNDSTWWLNNR